MATGRAKKAKPKSLSNFSLPTLPVKQIIKMADSKKTTKEEVATKEQGVTVTAVEAPGEEAKKPAADAEPEPEAPKGETADNVTVTAVVIDTPAVVTQKPAVKPVQTAQASSAPRAISTGVRSPAPTYTPPKASLTTPQAQAQNMQTGARTAQAINALRKGNVVKKTPEEVVGDLLNTVPAAYRYPVTRMYDYIARMNPAKREDVAMGSAEQVALYRSITTVINGDERYFAPLFTAMLRLFNAFSGERDVFHDYNCSRYMQEVPLNVDERKAFNNLVCFMKLMANPETRRITARTTDHNRLLAYGLTDSGRNRVTSFLEL